VKETLNLLPSEVKVRRGEKKEIFFYLFYALAVYLVVITGLWFFKIIENRKFDSEISKLDKQKAELQQRILAASPVPAVLNVDKEILGAVEKAPKWSSIISDISVIVPENVWLSSIESKEEKGLRHLSIKGFSTTQLGIANFISALETSKYLYDVEIVFSQKGDKDISFELKTKVRWT